MNLFKIKRTAASALPLLSGALAILLAVSIILAPESSFAASLQGVKLWWTLVFPALLPFLILSEMLSASGFVHALGVLLSPLMTRLFRLPGAGGWTLALGLTAGFPAGAESAAKLHKQGGVSADAAARLASLAHFASPVTIVIVIGTALLHSPVSGYVLLCVHWAAGLLAGVTAARLPRRAGPAPAGEAAPAAPGSAAAGETPPGRTRASLPARMHRAAADARAADGRSFGKLLGEAVTAAVSRLMVVGGFIIIFAVAVNILGALLPQLPAALAPALLEMHLGANALAGSPFPAGPQPSTSTLGLALMSAALGWSGICAQLQAVTALRPANAALRPFAVQRALHALYAFALTPLCWKPLSAAAMQALPASAGADGSVRTQAGSLWSFIPGLLGLQALLLIVLTLVSAIVYVIYRRRPAG